MDDEDEDEKYDPAASAGALYLGAQLSANNPSTPGIAKGPLAISAMKSASP